MTGEKTETRLMDFALKQAIKGIKGTADILRNRQKYPIKGPFRWRRYGKLAGESGG